MSGFGFHCGMVPYTPPPPVCRENVVFITKAWSSGIRTSAEERPHKVERTVSSTALFSAWSRQVKSSHPEPLFLFPLLLLDASFLFVVRVALIGCRNRAHFSSSPHLEP